MAEIVDVLKKWFTSFIKHKDMYLKNIVSMEENANTIIIHEANNNKTAMVIPKLARDSFLGQDTVITLNSKENIDMIISCWPDISKKEQLTIYLVNPYSLTEKYWALKPAIHERITERRALRKGLEALFSTVEAYVEV